MPTKTRRTSQDRKRVSSQPHEIKYTGGKVARDTSSTRKQGSRAVKKAKKQTGTVSRGPVEKRAEKIASRGASSGPKRRSKAPPSRNRASTGRSGRSQHLSHTTTDHEEIRHWAEERGAHPASVKRTNRGRSTGIIRLDFPGFTGAGTLEPISWDEFFDKFEDSKLALVYQDHTAEGERSNFNKLVRRR